MHLGEPGNRFGRDQRPRSDFERVDLTGLDEFVDGAAADTERSGRPILPPKPVSVQCCCLSRFSRSIRQLLCLTRCSRFFYSLR